MSSSQGASSDGGSSLEVPSLGAGGPDLSEHSSHSLTPQRPSRGASNEGSGLFGAGGSGGSNGLLSAGRSKSSTAGLGLLGGSSSRETAQGRSSGEGLLGRAGVRLFGGFGAPSDPGSLFRPADPARSGSEESPEALFALGGSEAAEPPLLLRTSASGLLSWDTEQTNDMAHRE